VKNTRSNSKETKKAKEKKQIISVEDEEVDIQQLDEEDLESRPIATVVGRRMRDDLHIPSPFSEYKHGTPPVSDFP
jgi:hypothetical protein